MNHQSAVINHESKKGNKTPSAHDHSRGMTLIETLVAITILTVSIVAPMALTMQSLAAAYHARDQVIASNLAQEAIEALRSVRDGNILSLALQPSVECTPGVAMHLLCKFEIGANFTINTSDNNIVRCGTAANAPCPPLMLSPTASIYGYGTTGWTNTIFTRTVFVEYVGAAQDEIRIHVTVTRQVGAHVFPAVELYENLYRWVDDEV